MTGARADWEARIGRSRAAAGHDLPRLAAPAGVTARAGRGQVTLDWDPVAGAAGYLVERADRGDGEYHPLAIGEPLVPMVPHPPFTDTTGVPGEPVRYRVSAVASVDDRGQPRSLVVDATPAIDGDAACAIVVDASRSLGLLDRPWRPMIGSEHLSLLEYGVGPGGRVVGEELAEALRLAHDELGVEAVRAHSILHDELGVYREVAGEPRHDFTAIGRLYDRVLALGLRPIVELGFMPADLARDPGRTVFEYRAIISPPRSLERWADLVRGLVTFLVDRYGIDEVRGWAFEVWNEANLEVFWAGTQEEYLALYDVTAAAVKSVDARLRVGGPASAAVGWLDELLAHASASGSAVDFLSTHCYGQAPLDLRPITARHGFPGLPQWWTEWGAHASHFNGVHDSPWAAAYLVRGMASAMGRTEALSYWTVSDHFEELGWPPALLHGGFGLLSVGNLRKPRWWALWMLERLGAERVAVEVTGDGAGDMVNAVASRSPDGTRVVIVVWNGTVDVGKADGAPLLDRAASVTVDGLEPGRWRMRHRRVDEGHSNLAARWRALGGGAAWPDDDRWRALRETDVLDDLEPQRAVTLPDGRLALAFDLPMPAVSLVELERGVS